MKLSLPCLLATLTLATYTAPADAHSRRPTPPATGYVSIDNHAGVPMTVTVEGSGSRVLAAWESGRFATYEGDISVRAAYTQYGSSFSLVNREVRVRAHRTTDVTLNAPDAGKVRLVNDTGVASTVFLNGRTLANLSAGSTRILSVPLGPNELTMVANGVRVESARVDVRPFSESTVVGKAPAFADLIVSNPLPFAVDVTVDHGSARRLSATSSTVFPHVRVGRVEVESKRIGGYLIDEEPVSVRAWSGAEMTIDTPRTGLVKLDNDARELVRVFVDGRLVSLLEPHADATLLLPAGPVVLEVRTLQGGLVERSYVVVDPLRTTSLDFGRDHDGRVSQHDGECTHAGTHEVATR